MANFTNSSEVPGNWTVHPEVRPSDVAIAVWLAFTLTLCGLAVLSNIGMQVVTFARSTAPSPIKLLVANLCMTYLLSALIFAPVSALRMYYRYQDVQFPTGFCRYFHSCYVVVIVVSFWTNACLAINRLVAICLPLMYRDLMTTQITKWMVALTWIISVILLLPTMFGVGGVYDNPGGTEIVSVCFFTITSPYGNLVMNVYASAIPIVIVAVAATTVTVKTVVAKIRRRRVVERLQADVQVESRLLQRRLHIAKMLLLSFGIFLLCSAPVPLEMMSLNVRALIGRVPMLREWTRCISLLEYALNPIIFFSMNHDYSNSFAILRQRWITSISGRTSRSVWPSLVF
ncbi:hypothetical protein BV898_08213 [Hypsibius exemplaris]|uniref:G-protein coupled receptors family 1 profile domain-containing protein n=1 Tax=Hypsibius exemplaris TaxID=2072580 RepID=A0A1W0WRD3_HYPEX|nr:hypothetical protein BV898_08213 [Hypsibius exemplaris]